MSTKKKIQLDKKWVYREAEKLFKSEKYSETLVKILSARGISTEAAASEFLNPKYEKLADPYLLKDMDKAVQAVLLAIDNNEKITVYGDYDVDGITATTLLTEFFDEIGVDSSYYIPSRQTEGYGLNKEAIKALSKNGTKVLITVDCGSTSIEEVEYANSLGLKVVVTDHHSLKIENGKDILPPAAAVVNPRRSDSEFQQYLAGVGVAFYLVRALQLKLLAKLPQGQEKWFLDLVALGTVCDVVPLVGDNRILVSFGLKVLSKTRRIGFKQLAKIAEFELKEISPYHLGFLIGPRLNAAGRLETAEGAIRLLKSKDPLEAERFARELDTINKERQELTEKILNEARELIDNEVLEKNIYLLSDKNWPAGVVGIVASRLVDEFGKPVLVMEENGEDLKGSARSINCFNIVEALSECSEFLSHFGGHAFAAGFSLKKEHFILLDEKMIKISNERISKEDLVKVVNIDTSLELEEIHFDLYEELKLLEPYGPGNPKPVFSLEECDVVDFRLVGNQGNHLKLTVTKDERAISGMFFNYCLKEDIEIGKKVSVAMTLEENIWKGNRSLEFRAIDLKVDI